MSKRILSFAIAALCIGIEGCGSSDQTLEEKYKQRYDNCMNYSGDSVKKSFDKDTAICTCNNKQCRPDQACNSFGQCVDTELVCNFANNTSYCSNDKDAVLTCNDKRVLINKCYYGCKEKDDGSGVYCGKCADDRIRCIDGTHYAICSNGIWENAEDRCQDGAACNPAIKTLQDIDNICLDKCSEIEASEICLNNKDNTIGSIYICNSDGSWQPHPVSGESNQDQFSCKVTDDSISTTIGECINGLKQCNIDISAQLDECIEGQWTKSVDCPHGCKNGRCKDQDCSTDEECKDGMKCDSGQCVSSLIEDKCTKDSDCDDGKTCVNGKCISSPTPQKPECESNIDCDNGKTCKEGQCISPTPQEPECESDPDCDDGKTCEEGQCISPTPQKPECESNSDCSNGQECNEDKKCIDSLNPQQECIYDSDCEPNGDNYVCLDNKCKEKPSCPQTCTEKNGIGTVKCVTSIEEKNNCKDNSGRDVSCNNDKTGCGNCLNGSYQCKDKSNIQKCKNGDWSTDLISCDNVNCNIEAEIIKANNDDDAIEKLCPKTNKTITSCDDKEGHGVLTYNDNSTENCEEFTGFDVSCNKDKNFCGLCLNGTIQCSEDGQKKQTCENGQWQDKTCSNGCDTTNKECKTDASGCSEGVYFCNSDNILYKCSTSTAGTAEKNELGLCECSDDIKEQLKELGEVEPKDKALQICKTCSDNGHYGCVVLDPNINVPAICDSGEWKSAPKDEIIYLLKENGELRCALTVCNGTTPITSDVKYSCDHIIETANVICNPKLPPAELDKQFSKLSINTSGKPQKVVLIYGETNTILSFCTNKSGNTICYSGNEKPDTCVNKP